MASTDSKLITVLLPVVDCKYLVDTLKSIQEQTLDCVFYDLVIINDGTDRDSIDRAIRKSNIGCSLRVIDSNQSGIVGALNLGLSVSNTKYIARIDQDDLMCPDRLKMQLEYLECNKQVLCLGGQIQLIDSLSNTIGYSYFPRPHWLIKRTMFLSSPMAHPSVMFRTSDAKSIGGYRKGVPEDWDLWIRFSEIGRLANLKDILIKYRIHENQLSRTKLYQTNNAMDAIEISSKLRKMELVDLPESGEDLRAWRIKNFGLLALKSRNVRLIIWKVIKFLNYFGLSLQSKLKRNH